ncbi:hypothetical protein LCGC14_0535100 [marine sediment metagenome]|uniref:Zona occludens toxin N-terminal domain-containing protein n=1 Tax=marine sediment metagenome TaxID=412755 RepID=A0A0F9SCV1_9ZZZZ
MNRDTIIIMVGEKRTGKSWAAMKIAEKLDKNFDPAKQVFFDVGPFLQWFNDTKDSVAVIDEVSVNFANAQTWYAVENRIMRTLLTTQGYKRNTLIMTLPSITHLSKSSFELAHILMASVNTGIFRCYRIKTNQLSRKTYPIGFEMLRFDKPRDDTIAAYEKKKDEWNKSRLAGDLDYIRQLSDVSNFQKQLSMSEYLKGFKLGLMDEDVVKAKIVKMGYSEKDVEMVLKMESMKTEDKSPEPFTYT